MKKQYAFGWCLAISSSLSACGSNSSDPAKWSCKSLIPAIISMSEEKDVKILEITAPEEFDRTWGPEPSITCHADAVWSDDGGSMITYGAEVSPGGSIMLSYEQR